MPVALDHPLFDKIEFGPECWEWLGNIAVDSGYGRYGKPKRYAHRLVYEAVVGPIPDGLVIDHLCRNRSCVNPDHLEPVTRGENVLRGETIPAANKVKTHCMRGHLLQGDQVYVDRKGHRRCQVCMRAYMRDYHLQRKRLPFNG